MYDVFSQSPALQASGVAGQGAVQGNTLGTIQNLNQQLVGPLAFADGASGLKTVNVSAGLSGYLGTGHEDGAKRFGYDKPAPGSVEGNPAFYRANFHSQAAQQSHWDKVRGHGQQAMEGRPRGSTETVAAQVATAGEAAGLPEAPTQPPSPPSTITEPTNPGTPTEPTPVTPTYPELPPIPGLGDPSAGIPGSYLDNGNPNSGIPSMYLDNGDINAGIPSSYLQNGNPGAGIPEGYPNYSGPGIPEGYPNYSGPGIPSGYPNYAGPGIPSGYPNYSGPGIPSTYPGGTYTAWAWQSFF